MAQPTLPATNRDLRLALSVLNEYIINGQQALAAAQIASIKAAIDAEKVLIDAATDSTLTTL